MLLASPRRSAERDVSHTFAAESIEWEGLYISADVEISAHVSEPYNTDEDGRTRDCKVYAEILTRFEIHGDDDDLPADAVRLIRAKYEADIIEAVKASVGDIEYTLMQQYAD